MDELSVCSVPAGSLKKRIVSQPPYKPSAGTEASEAAYLDMVREEKRLNRLKARAVIAASYEAAMFWRFRREALKAEFLAKGGDCSGHH